MGKKSDGKGKSKGSQLVIRIDKAERDAFVSLCDRLDTSAAREIRRFMRGFVAAHAAVDDTSQSEAEAEAQAPASAPATAPTAPAPDLTPVEKASPSGSAP